jgi:DNA-binding transcriptional MerR regulator
MSMQYPIKVVANQTGIAPATLRAWEKRYSSVTPERDAGGRRLYSETLLQRLRLISDLVNAGFRVSDVVDLDADALEQRHDEFVAAPKHSAPKTTTSDDPVAAAIDATIDFNLPRLNRIIVEASEIHGELAMIDGFVFPVLSRMTALIDSGAAKPVHRSTLESALHTFLYERLPPLREASDRPIVAVAVPKGQDGTTGAVSSMLHASAVGWYPVMLGTDVSGGELAVAAHKIGCKAILLSIGTVKKETELVSEVEKLTSATHGEPPVFFGGRLSPRVVATLTDTGLQYLENMGALRRTLATIIE